MMHMTAPASAISESVAGLPAATARAVHPGWLANEPHVIAPADDAPEGARFAAFMQLLKTAGALDRAAADALADLDLTAGAFGALLELGEVGETGVAPSELARRLAVARRTATLYVDILALQGWAERRAHPADRRMVLATLTPAGYQLLDDLADAFKRRLATLMGEISPIQAERLRQLLALIPNRPLPDHRRVSIPPPFAALSPSRHASLVHSRRVARDTARHAGFMGRQEKGEWTVWGFFSWIIFGALAGWVASLLAGTNDRQGCLTNILVGVVGAFIGGFLFSLLTGDDIDFGWNLGSFAVAVIGALILLGILRAVRR